ncbi:hypothetical protein BOTBODRAFT_357037 [Botryobasidium botryosum FD-172 SS1]|uniref:Uncharacterized protein n=1 Tax=Botryobasidium botryosum (strain FD-172 SS1) TaxID=930990 RepID=A0A067ME06_BOTB1|nr:hypothetical protein BOTBODRAFT_357037 [Botryobasidium botryosum FD-172 SS1]
MSWSRECVECVVWASWSVSVVESTGCGSGSGVGFRRLVRGSALSTSSSSCPEQLSDIARSPSPIFHSQYQDQSVSHNS